MRETLRLRLLLSCAVLVAFMLPCRVLLAFCLAVAGVCLTQANARIFPNCRCARREFGFALYAMAEHGTDGSSGRLRYPLAGRYSSNECRRWTSRMNLASRHVRSLYFCPYSQAERFIYVLSSFIKTKVPIENKVSRKF